MAFRIDPALETPDSAAAIAVEQLTLARGLLYPHAADLDDAIHEGRRAIRRLRALLELLRPALGDRYDAVRAPFHEASALLSPLRDAGSSIEALDRIVGKDAEQRWTIPPGQLRAALEKRHERVRKRAPRVIAKVQVLLEGGAALIDTWRGAATSDALLKGLALSRKRAFRALERATARPGAESTHRLRRRSRDLALQLALLADIGKKHALERSMKIRRIARLLGREREKLLLIRFLRRLEPTELFPGPAIAAFRDELDERRRKLRRRAIKLARKLL